MNQLLLSSQRLDSNKVLQTGEFNVFEMLRKHGILDILNLKIAVPKKALMLEWKEIKTPKTPLSFKDLVGKKLMEYKFQYLGKFKYDGKYIDPATETFASSFPDRNIYNNEIKSTGWLNCTWLIDFLMNAAAIQANTLRQEFIIWNEEDKNYSLSLSTEAADMRSAEQEKFVFRNDFTTMTWEHMTLFSQ
jgi:hypothetical protein